MTSDFKTIHRLFEEQVERTPDNIAIVGNGGGVCGSSGITSGVR